LVAAVSFEFGSIEAISALPPFVRTGQKSASKWYMSPAQTVDAPPNPDTSCRILGLNP
jgi:hypothetical protein